MEQRWSEDFFGCFVLKWYSILFFSALSLLNLTSSNFKGLNVQELKVQTNLSEAALSQDFDEEEVVEGHPLNLWDIRTFDLSVLLARLALQSLPAAANSALPRHQDNGGRGCERDRVLLVVVAAVVEGKSLPDVLQLLLVFLLDKSTRQVSKYPFKKCHAAH